MVGLTSTLDHLLPMPPDMKEMWMGWASSQSFPGKKPSLCVWQRERRGKKNQEYLTERDPLPTSSFLQHPLPLVTLCNRSCSSVSSAASTSLLLLDLHLFVSSFPLTSGRFLPFPVARLFDQASIQSSPWTLGSLGIPWWT